MKNAILLALLILVLGSCVNDSNSSSSTELEGSYELTEQFTDIGNGSGTFQPVESNNVVTLADGEIITNTNLCDRENNTGELIFGTYSLQDSTLQLPSCSNLPFSHENNALTIYYFCTEGCADRYTRR